jgi:hypothetical protein
MMVDGNHKIEQAIATIEILRTTDGEYYVDDPNRYAMVKTSLAKQLKFQSHSQINLITSSFCHAEKRP